MSYEKPPTEAEVRAMSRALIAWFKSQDIGLADAVVVMVETIATQTATHPHYPTLTKAVEALDVTMRSLEGFFWTFAPHRFADEVFDHPRYLEAMSRALKR